MYDIILQKEHILGSPLQRIPVTILFKYIWTMIIMVIMMETDINVSFCRLSYNPLMLNNC